MDLLKANQGRTLGECMLAMCWASVVPVGLMLAAGLMMGAGSAHAADHEPIVYPSNPDHQSDGMITGTINGRPVEFEYQHTYHHSRLDELEGFDCNYVRLAAGGKLDVELTVNAEINEAYLRTLGKDLPMERDGSTMRFTLPGPGNYYVKLPDLNKPGWRTYTVFFFVDEPAAYHAYQREFEEAVDVTEHGVISDATKDQTEQIQRLLDEHEKIYFPNGIYRSGCLNVPSDTTMLLDAGAILKGTDAYDKSPYIHVVESRNVRIAGLGTIDANGNVEGNHSTKIHLSDIERSRNIRMDGLVLCDSNSWMLHVRDCDDIHFHNLHLFSGKDGIDPDSSRDFLVEDVTIQSIDDGFAVKSKRGTPTEHVMMRNCIVFSAASALKIGTENYDEYIRDITWDNCETVDSDRGCILYTNESGAAPISDITWRNIRVFTFDWENETGGAAFQFENEKENAGGDITNVRLQNIVAYPKEKVDITEEGGIVEVLFQNVIVHGDCEVEDSPNTTFRGVIWEGVESEPVPVVFIEPSPRSQNKYVNGDELRASVQHPEGRPIARVEWMIDGEAAGVDASEPFTLKLAGIPQAEHQIVARAVDEDGRANQTAPVRIEVVEDAPMPGLMGAGVSVHLSR